MQELQRKRKIYMQKILTALAALLLCMLVLPLLGYLVPANSAAAPQPPLPAEGAPSAPAKPAVPSAAGSLLLHIYNTDTGQTDEVTMRSYVIGAVAAEMPCSWPDEALKAQAVAAHSYALAQRQLAQAGKANTVPGADFAARPDCGLGWANEACLRQRWGDAYSEKMQRLSALTDEVMDEVLLYEGEVITACYSACAAGQTEAAQNVWGREVPYLTTVASPCDALADGFLTEAPMDRASVSASLRAAYGDIQLSQNPAEWFGAAQYTPAGYVAQQQVGNLLLSGVSLRETLCLRSACFSVEYIEKQELFIFTTKGYGHGVGLSQWGAKGEAEQGKTYRQILAQYYPGTQLGSAL